MRDYSKVSPQFWIGTTGKQLRAAGREAQVVAMYLMTSPHSNMIGLYYMPRMFIAHETGLGDKGASKGLLRAIDAGFCVYDEASEMVWVLEMAEHQIAERLEVKDKRCLGIQREYDAQPENPFLPAFFDRYSVAFHMSRRRTKASPFEAPTEPHRSQEQEQEQEQEQDQEQEQEQAGASSAPPTDPCPVRAVFDHWRTVHEHAQAQLGTKRRKAIEKALELYPVDVLCESIAGYRNSSFHMGNNDRGQVYDDIGLMLRDEKQIEQGLNFARTQPHPKMSALTRKNVSNTEGWVPPEMRRAAS